MASFKDLNYVPQVDVARVKEVSAPIINPVITSSRLQLPNMFGPEVKAQSSKWAGAAELDKKWRDKGDYAYTVNSEQYKRYLDPIFSKKYLMDPRYFDNEEIHARQQSGINRLVNAVPKFGATFLQGFVANFTGLPGQYDAGINVLLHDMAKNAEDLYPHYYTKAELNSNSALKGIIPFTQGSGNFWGDKFLKNLGFTAGALSGALLIDAIVTYATRGIATPAVVSFQIGRALKYLSKAFKNSASLSKILQAPKIAVAGKLVKNTFSASDDIITTYNSYSTGKKFLTNAKAAMMLGVASNGESYIEALDGSIQLTDMLTKDFVAKNNRMPNEQELKEIKGIAESTANGRYALNFAVLMGTNAIQFASLFSPFKALTSGTIGESFLTGGLKTSGKTSIDKATGKMVLKTFKDYSKLEKAASIVGSPVLTNNISEALQEGLQYSFETAGEDYAKKRYNHLIRGGVADYVSSQMEGFRRMFADKEGRESMLLGFLTGFVIHGGVSTYNRMSGRPSEKEVLEKSVTDFNKFDVKSLIDVEGWSKDVLQRDARAFDEKTIQEVILIQMDKAIKDGDFAAFRSLQHEQLVNMVRSSMTTDKFDARIEQLKAFKNMPAVDFFNAFGIPVTSEMSEKEDLMVNSLVDKMIDKARKIKDIAEAVDGMFENPTTSLKTDSDVRQFRAFENYKDTIIMQLSQIEDINGRIPSIIQDMIEVYPELTTDIVMSMGKVGKIEELHIEPLEAELKSLNATIDTLSAIKTKTAEDNKMLDKAAKRFNKLSSHSQIVSDIIKRLNSSLTEIKIGEETSYKWNDDSRLVFKELVNEIIGFNIEEKNIPRPTKEELDTIVTSLIDIHRLNNALKIAVDENYKIQTPEGQRKFIAEQVSLQEDSENAYLEYMRNLRFSSIEKNKSLEVDKIKQAIAEARKILSEERTKRDELKAEVAKLREELAEIQKEVKKYGEEMPLPVQLENDLIAKDEEHRAKVKEFAELDKYVKDIEKGIAELEADLNRLEKGKEETPDEDAPDEDAPDEDTDETPDETPDEVVEVKASQVADELSLDWANVPLDFQFSEFLSNMAKKFPISYYSFLKTTGQDNRGGNFGKKPTDNRTLRFQNFISGFTTERFTNWLASTGTSVAIMQIPDNIDGVDMFDGEYWPEDAKEMERGVAIFIVDKETKSPVKVYFENGEYKIDRGQTGKKKVSKPTFYITETMPDPLAVDSLGNEKHTIEDVAQAKELVFEMPKKEAIREATKEKETNIKVREIIKADPSKIIEVSNPLVTPGVLSFVLEMDEGDTYKITEQDWESPYIRLSVATAEEVGEAKGFRRIKGMTYVDIFDENDKLIISIPASTEDIKKIKDVDGKNILTNVASLIQFVVKNRKAEDWEKIDPDYTMIKEIEAYLNTIIYTKSNGFKVKGGEMIASISFSIDGNRNIIPNIKFQRKQGKTTTSYNSTSPGKLEELEASTDPVKTLKLNDVMDGVRMDISSSNIRTNEIIHFTTDGKKLKRKEIPYKKFLTTVAKIQTPVYLRLFEKTILKEGEKATPIVPALLGKGIVFDVAFPKNEQKEITLITDEAPKEQPSPVVETVEPVDKIADIEKRIQEIFSIVDTLGKEPSEFKEDLIISVESLSLEQALNNPEWAGYTKKGDQRDVDFIKEYIAKQIERDEESNRTTRFSRGWGSRRIKRLKEIQTAINNIELSALGQPVKEQEVPKVEAPVIIEENGKKKVKAKRITGSDDKSIELFSSKDSERILAPEITQADIDRVQKIFGKNVRIDNIPNLFRIANSSSWAKWSNSVITLFYGANTSDLWHEAWHNFSQPYLTKEQKADIYNEFRKVNNVPEASDREVEELIAREFSQYAIADGKYDLSKYKKSKSIFQYIWDFIKSIFSKNKNNSLSELYEMLYKGEIASFSPSVENMLFDTLLSERNFTDTETDRIMTKIDALFIEEIYGAKDKQGNPITILDISMIKDIDVVYKKILINIINEANDLVEFESDEAKEGIIQEENLQLHAGLSKIINNWNEVVAVHKSSDFMKNKFPKYTLDDDGNLIYKDEEGKNKDGTSFQDESEVSLYERIDGAVLTLIETLVDNETIDPDFGRGSLVDSDKIIGLLANKLADTDPSNIYANIRGDGMMDKLYQLSHHTPVIRDLAEKLEIRSSSGLMLLSRFVSSFCRPRNELSILFAKQYGESQTDRGETVIRTLKKDEIIFIDSDISSLDNQKIENALKNYALTTETKFTENQDGQIIIPKSKLDQIKKTETPSEFYYNLGIDISILEKAGEKSREILSPDKISRVKSILEKHFKRNKFITDIYEVLKVNGENSILATLVKENKKHNVNYISNSVINPEGKNESEINQWNRMNIVVNALNDTVRFPTLSSLYANPETSFLQNISWENSPLLKLLFNEEGKRVRIDGKPRRIWVENYSGITTKVDETEDSEGTKIKGASIQDKIISDIINLTKFKKYPTLQLGDKSAFYALLLGKFLVDAEFITPNGSFVDAMMGYLKDELETISKFKAGDENITKLEKVKSHIVNDNGEYQFGLFRDIIKGELAKKLINSKNYDSTITSNEAEIRMEIKNWAEGEVQEIMNYIVKNSFGSQKLESFLGKPEKKDDKPLRPEEIKAYRVGLVNKFFMNQFLFNVESSKVFFGDVYSHKDPFKRVSGGTSTGVKPITDPLFLEILENLSGGVSHRGLFLDYMKQKHKIDFEFANKRKSKFETRFITFKDKKVGSVILDDLLKEVDEQIALSTDESVKEDLQNRRKSIEKAYGSVNESDAFGVCTLDFYRKTMNLMGRWDPKLERVYQKSIKWDILTKKIEDLEKQYEKTEDKKGVQEQISLLQTELDGTIISEAEITHFNIQKWQYFGNTENPSFNEVQMHKFELMPLIPQMIKGKKWEKHAERMMLEDADYAVFDSGSKMEKSTPDDFYTNEQRDIDTIDTLIENGIYKGGVSKNSYNIQTGYLANLREQVKVDSGVYDDLIFGTQVRKLLFNYFNKGEAIVSEMTHKKTKYDHWIAGLVNREKSNVAREAGIEEYLSVRNETRWKIVNEKRFAEFLKRELEKKTINQNVFEYLDLNQGGKLKYKLDLSIHRQQIENILTSVINNRVVRQMTHGEMKIQASSTGFEEFSSSRPNGTNGLRFYTIEKDGKDIKVRKMQVKVALTGQFKNLLKKKYKNAAGEDVEIGDIKTLNALLKSEEWVKENSKLITMVGYRIPTQEHNSVEVMEIEEFLPEIAGSIIVVPTEITAKAGSDFDIDKLNIFKPNISPEGEYINDKINSFKKTYQNKLIEVASEAVLHPSNYINLMTPNSTFVYDTPISNIMDALGEAKTDSKMTKMFSPVESWKTFNILYDAKRALGIAAQSNTFTQLLQQSGMMIRKGKISTAFNVQRDENGNILLGNRTSNNKTQKATIISQAINLFVDVANDPRSGFVNLGEETAPVYFLGIHMGLDADQMLYFLNQPLIRYYVGTKRYMDSTLTGTSDYRKKSPEAILAEVMKQLDTKSTPEGKKFSAVISDMKDEKLREIVEVSAEKLLENIKSKNKDLDYYTQQVALLKEYMEMDSFADTFREMQSSMNFDTSKSLNSIEASLRIAAQAKFAREDIFLGYGNLLSNSTTSVFNVDRMILNINSAALPLMNDPIITNRIKSILKVTVGGGERWRWKASKRNKFVRTYRNDLVSFIFQNFIVRSGKALQYYNSLFGHLPEFKPNPNVFARHLIKNLYLELKEKKESHPELFKRYTFLENLYVSSSSSHVPEIKNIGLIFYNKHVRIQNSYIKQIKELKNIPEMKDFINKLSFLSFYQSGLNKSPISFVDVLDISDLAEMFNHIYEQFEKEVVNQPQRKKLEGIINIFHNGKLGGSFFQNNDAFRKSDPENEQYTVSKIAQNRSKTNSWRWKIWEDQELVDAVLDAEEEDTSSVSKVLEGDIFTLPGIPVITTNLGGVHGAGLAQAAKSKGLITQGDGEFKASDKVVQFPVKKKWSDSMSMNDNMGLLKSSLAKLEKVASENKDRTYLLPLAGLGHGEGKIEEILPLLISTIKNSSNIKLVLPAENINLGRQGTVRKDYTRENMPKIKEMLSAAGILENEVVEIQDETKPEFNKLPGKSSTPTMTYAGIGSRETPKEILDQMTEAAEYLESLGYTLRSGAAEGADTAFESGVKTKKEIFEGFAKTGETEIKIAHEIHPDLKGAMEAAKKRAEKKGKDGERSAWAVQNLMARNTNQVFGKNLDTPVDFVLFYAEETSDPLRPKGGTGQAVEMARRKGIPTINMANVNWKEQLASILSEKIAEEIISDQMAEESKPSTSVKPTIDTSKEWKGDLESRPVYTGKGFKLVNTMRTSAAGPNGHFGNPFSEAGYAGTIKVASIREAVVAYKEWLLGTNHQDVKPQQRKWILDQINQGKLDGATLLYAGKSAARGQGMHPTALVEVVEQLRGRQAVSDPSTETKINIYAGTNENADTNQQLSLFEEPEEIKEVESVAEDTTDVFKYYGAMYTIVLDSTGRGVDVLNYKGKNSKKQSLLDAYNEDPDVDPQTGQPFRNFPKVEPKIEQEEIKEFTKNVVVPKGSNPSNLPVAEDDENIYLMNDGQQEAYNFLKERVLELLDKNKFSAISERDLDDTVEFDEPLSKGFSGVIPKKMWDNMLGLAGRGGTGKTTIIRKVLEDILQSRHTTYSRTSKVFLAPTHQAATVSQEAIGADSERANDGGVLTLAHFTHRKLRKSSKDAIIDDGSEGLYLAKAEVYEKSIIAGFSIPVSSPDIIIVDESSMLGKRDIEDYIFRMRSDIKTEGDRFTSTKMPVFIFMGDYRQLGKIKESQSSKINKGIISTSLLFNNPEKTRELTEIMRSDDKDMHDLYDTIGDQIGENMRRYNRGEDPAPIDWKVYDRINKSSKNILMVNDEEQVIEDYANYLANNDDPYGMFWVHYNRVDHQEKTIPLLVKIRNKYFNTLLTNKQITPKDLQKVKGRRFLNKDYIQFTGTKEMPLPKLGKIGGGFMKPQSRFKVVSIENRKFNINELSRIFGIGGVFPDIQVDVEVINIINRQLKNRVILLPKDITVKTAFVRDEKKAFMAVDILHEGKEVFFTKVPYSKWEGIQGKLALLAENMYDEKTPDEDTSFSKNLVPSYIGSSHTAQGASIKNVIVGDYNIRENSRTVNQDDILSSLYTALTRASKRLIIIKPKGIGIENNQGEFSGYYIDNKPIVEEKENDETMNCDLPF